MLDFLEKLDNQNIRFALSNVLSSKGKTNEILKHWLKNKKYKVHHLKHKYSNSNYQIKDKNFTSDEVLIIRNKMENFRYKSYCWSLGTTSFRTENFNKNIELQLKLLNDFWQLPKNIGQEWIGNRILQSNYYDFLKDNGFVIGVANNKDKDARQKTSGLVDIGLIDNNRKLTEVGYKLLQVSESRDFSTDNLLQISKDSFYIFKTTFEN